MKVLRLITLLLSLTVGSLALSAQVNIQGVVRDSAAAPLAGTTVLLLRAADSVLTHYTVADAQGQFQLRRVPAGSYLLRATFVGFADHQQAVTVAGEAEMSLPPIVLLPVATTMTQIEVSAERFPILIKGDTVEYDAQSFAVQPDAPVEELLRRLPGVEVDRDGAIRAQGERVDRVLVDGKEFFGTDPTVATRNLPANAIDRVQVFDRQSEAEAFTGVDDGRRSTTINLSLKSDRRGKVFGKLSGGYGDQGRYDGSLNLFRFQEAQQLAAIGMANNINQQGFSVQDYLSFTGALRNGGRVRIELGDNDSGDLPLGEEAVPGFHHIAAGGVNLSQDFGEATELRGSYFYYQRRDRLDEVISRLYPTLSNGLRNDLRNDRTDRLASHRLDLTLRHQPDSLQRLTLNTQLWYSQGLLYNQSSNRVTSKSDPIGSLLEQTYERDRQRLQGQVEGSYMRRLGRAGRFLSLTVGGRSGRLEEDGSLFQSDGLLTVPVTWLDSLYQEQAFRSQPLSLNERAALTDRLGKHWRAELFYEHNYERDRQSKDFLNGFDQNLLRDEELSGRFRTDYYTHQPGLGLTWQRGEHRLNAELAYQALRLDALVEQVDSWSADRRFSYWLPRLRYGWEMGNGRRLDAQYSTRTQAPTAEQLLPIVDNSNPLRIYQGNPDLRPEYQHQLQLNLTLFDQFSGSSFIAFTQFNYLQNALSSSQRIDSLLRQYWRPINVDQAYRANAYLDFGFALRPLRSRLGLTLSANYNQGEVLLNDLPNRYRQWLLRPGLRLENNRKEKIDLSASWTYTFNTTRFEQATAGDNDFGQHDLRLNATWNAGLRWALNSQLDYYFFERTAFAAARDFPLWQASVKYFFLPGRRASAELGMVDILDRNRGIERRSQLNFLEETYTHSLGRYLLFRMTYRLKG